MELKVATPVNLTARQESILREFAYVSGDRRAVPKSGLKRLWDKLASFFFKVLAGPMAVFPIQSILNLGRSESMEEITTRIMEWGALYGLNIIGALFILIIGLQVARLLARLFRRILNKAKVEETLTIFLGQLVKYVLMAVVIVAALNKVGFQTTSIIAIVGAAGLAVGLALQSHMSSLAAGVLILLFRPFAVGHFIETAGTMGTVEGISLLTTNLKSVDGKLVVVPNTQVFSGVTVNYSAKPVRRIDLVLGVSYEDDLLKAKQVLMEVLTNDPSVLKDPAPRVDVMELADSSVNFAVRPWVNGEDWWDARCRIIEAAKLSLEAAGLTIPFPQRDVHLKKEE